MGRYTIDFEPAFEKSLDELIGSTGATSKADIIRKALASYKYLKDAERQGGKVSITNQQDEVQKDVVLP